mgnify:CR=1 FL=1
MKKELPNHPLEIYTGIKTFTIAQKCLAKDKSLLSIDPNQCIEDYKSTLLHEICHIGYEIFGLNDDDEMPQIGNEYLTTVTSNMIFQLAGLNPELFQYIFNNE